MDMAIEKKPNDSAVKSTDIPKPIGPQTTRFIRSTGETEIYEEVTPMRNGKSRVVTRTTGSFQFD